MFGGKMKAETSARECEPDYEKLIETQMKLLKKLVAVLDTLRDLSESGIYIEYPDKDTWAMIGAITTKVWEIESYIKELRARIDSKKQ